MTSDRKLDTAIEMCLPFEARRRFETLMAVPSDDFVALVRAASLDPKTSFRGKVLRIDFGYADLNGFDFSGADLSACDLSQARLDGAIMTGARRGSGQRFMELIGHNGHVNSVAFSPKGDRIVSAGDDRTLRLWDARTGALKAEPLRGHLNVVRSVAFSPDGNQIISASDDRTLRLWDAAAGGPIGTPLHGHDGAILSVAYSPDGRDVISGDNSCAIALWDATKGTLERVVLYRNDAKVTDIAFSPDSSRIVSGGKLYRHVWDAATKTLQGKPLNSKNHFARCVAFSPNGNLIVSGSRNGNIQLWDAITGARLGDLMRGHEKLVRSVAFSPDSSRIVSGGDDSTLRLWDAATGAPLCAPLRGHKGGVRSVAFSPDGNRIISGGDDGKIIVWFLDPPMHQVFVSAHPETEAYSRQLLTKLLAHPEMIKRNVAEAIFDPLKHPRPDEGARAAQENSVAAVFIVGEKGLALMQHGELELAKLLQRKTGQPRIVPVFTSSASPNEPLGALNGYQFVHMPLDKPDAFNALVEAICQAVDAQGSHKRETRNDEALDGNEMEHFVEDELSKSDSAKTAKHPKRKYGVRPIEMARLTGRLPRT